jgi:hypothetical protein
VKSSKSARQKKSSRQTAEGLPVQSFQTLMAELASRARVTHGGQWEESNLTFQQVPEPTPLQPRACQLLDLLPVAGNRNSRYLTVNQENTLQAPVELRVKDYGGTVEYIHLNSVRRGLVKRCEEWKCSSFPEYASVDAAEQKSCSGLTSDRVRLSADEGARI